MKTLQFIILIIVITTACRGQTYTPIPTNSASWDCRSFAQIANTWFETICGDDTIINSIAYRKLMLYSYTYATGDIWDTLYFFAVRNDSITRKVFFVAPNDSVEHLLYDFNLNAGDSVTMYFANHTFNTKTVDSTWVSFISGANRKVISFQPDFGVVEQWIEGIGSTYGFSSRGRKLQMLDNDISLACFYANGSHIYSYDTLGTCREYNCSEATSSQLLSVSSVEVYPIPGQDFITVNNLFENYIYRIELCNLLGQVLLTKRTENNTETILISEFPSDMYVMKLFSPSGNRTVKILKR